MQNTTQSLSSPSFVSESEAELLRNPLAFLDQPCEEKISESEAELLPIGTRVTFNMNMTKQNLGESDNNYYACCRQPSPDACYVLRTKNGWITDSGRATRDINQNGGAVSFTSRAAAEKFRAAYVNPKWNVEVEEL